jgi:hypothetical protein
MTTVLRPYQDAESGPLRALTLHRPWTVPAAIVEQIERQLGGRS